MSQDLIPIDPEFADLDGHVRVAVGDVLRDRFQVRGVAGQGTFGTVLDCYDRKHKKSVAVKAVRAVKRYIEAGYVEAEILEKLRNADPNREAHCVRLYGYFEAEHRGTNHLFIIFESLGRSLFDVIKRNDYAGFPAEYVRAFAHQLLTAIAFCHRLELIHTDLKPENILLVNSESTICPERPNVRVPKYTEIRVIDFGGSTFDDEHHAKIINTRQYRAPEVILGLDWSFPSDLWSAGCILAELATGEMLFPTHEDLEHLAMMEKITQQHLPAAMCEAALRPYRRRVKKNDKKSDSKKSASESKEAVSASDVFEFPSLLSGPAAVAQCSSSTSQRAHASSRSRSPRRPESDRRSRKDDRHRDPSIQRTPSLSPQRSRHSKRSSSNPRADQLLHFRTPALRWPEAASSRDSKRAVEQTQTLSIMFHHDPDFVNLLQRLLCFDPAQRISASAALQHPYFTRAPIVGDADPERLKRATSSSSSGSHHEEKRRHHSGHHSHHHHHGHEASHSSQAHRGDEHIGHHAHHDDRHVHHGTRHDTYSPEMPRNRSPRYL